MPSRQFCARALDRGEVVFTVEMESDAVVIDAVKSLFLPSVHRLAE